MTSENQGRRWIGLLMVCVLVLLAAFSCDRHAIETTGVSLEKSALDSSLLIPWASLVDELRPTADARAPTGSYQIDQQCPMVYDFSIRWPLREGLSSETMGRVELGATPENPTGLELRNRATGTYPIHRQVRHPGHEWWNEEIAPIEVQFEANGLIPGTDWPGAWTAPHQPLGLAAFFPALPTDEITRWHLGSRSPDPSSGAQEDQVLAIHTWESGRFAVQDEAIRVIDARSSESGQSFSGRYLFSEKGRLLGAIWAASLSEGSAPAVATIRLTGSCDGVVMAPLPREENIAQDVIETWTRFASAMQSGESLRAVANLDPVLRDRYGEEELVLLLEQHLAHLGPRAFGRPVPQSIVEEGDRFRFTAVGVASDDESTAILTEVTARQTDQGVRLLRVRSTTDHRGEDWNLFDLSP